VIAKADTDPVVLQLTLPTSPKTKLIIGKSAPAPTSNAVNCGTGSDEMVFSTAALAAATAGQDNAGKAGKRSRPKNCRRPYVFSWMKYPARNIYHVSP